MSHARAGREKKNRGGKPPRRSVMNSRRVSRSAGRIDDERFAGSTMSGSPDRHVGRRAGPILGRS
jgi:hypothetical protein